MLKYLAFEVGDKDKIVNYISSVKNKEDAARLLELCALFDRHEEAASIIELYKHYLILSEMDYCWKQVREICERKNHINTLTVLSKYPEFL